MSTLALSTIETVARDVARRTLGADFIGDVAVCETTDEEGLAALRVVLVVTPEAVKRGEGLLSTSVSLQSALQARDEERFAYVSYITLSEREHGDDLAAA